MDGRDTSLSNLPGDCVYVRHLSQVYYRRVASRERLSTELILFVTYVWTKAQDSERTSNPLSSSFSRHPQVGVLTRSATS